MRSLALPAGQSYRAWGQLHGESFRGEIRALAEIRTPGHEGGSSGARAGLEAPRASPVSRDPPGRPRAAGIAEGAGGHRSNVSRTHRTSCDLDPVSGAGSRATDSLPRATTGHGGHPSSEPDGCSIVWSETPAGRILAQTWDMHATAIPYVMMLHVPESTDGPAASLLTVTGCLGMAGMNAARVGLAINNLFSTDATLGVVWPDRPPALHQRTAAAARDVIATSPIGSGRHYFVADRQAAFAIEASGTRRKQVFAAERPSFVHTNHSIDPEITARSRVPPTSTTFERMTWLESDLARSPIADLGDAWRRLGSEDGWPRSVCTNLATPEAPHGVATCGGIAMNLDTGEVDAQQGFIHNVAPERWRL